MAKNKHLKDLPHVDVSSIFNDYDGAFTEPDVPYPDEIGRRKENIPPSQRPDLIQCPRCRGRNTDCWMCNNQRYIKKDARIGGGEAIVEDAWPDLKQEKREEEMREMHQAVAEEYGFGEEDFTVEWKTSSNDYLETLNKDGHKAEMFARLYGKGIQPGKMDMMVAGRSGRSRFKPEPQQYKPKKTPGGEAMGGEVKNAVNTILKLKKKR